MVGEADKLAEHGVRVRILGDTSLLPAVSLPILEYFSDDEIAGRASCDEEGGGGDPGQFGVRPQCCTCLHFQVLKKYLSTTYIFFKIVDHEEYDLH